MIFTPVFRKSSNYIVASTTNGSYTYEIATTYGRIKKHK